MTSLFFRSAGGSLSLSLSFPSSPSTGIRVPYQFLRSWLLFWGDMEAVSHILWFFLALSRSTMLPLALYLVINWHLIQWWNVGPKNSTMSCAHPLSNCLWPNKRVGGHSTWNCTAVWKISHIMNVVHAENVKDCILYHRNMSNLKENLPIHRKSIELIPKM